MIGLIDRVRRSLIGRMRDVKAKYWHHSQGLDMTECGRSTLIMTLVWGSKENCIVKPTDGIWYWPEMQKVLAQRGMDNRLAAYGKLHTLDNKTAMIVRIKALGLIPHYVFVTRENSKDLRISDPLSRYNSRLQTPARLIEELVGSEGILVRK